MTNAPQRAVQGLRWFSNAGQLGWVLPASAPLRAGRVPNPKQATTVSPLTVAHLENRRTGDARWSALLGSWFIGFGVLRYRHQIQRGKLLKIMGSMMHAFCHKGKQKTLDGLLLRHSIHFPQRLGLDGAMAGSVPITACFQAVYLRAVF